MLYYLSGDDNWSIEQKVRAIAPAVPVITENVDDAITTSRTKPLLEPARVVWLKVSRLDTSLDLKAIQSIQLTENVLIIQASSPPDKRTTLGKWLTQNVECYEFNLIPLWKEANLAALASQLSKKVGINLSHSHLKQIISRVGNNPADIYSALERLKLYSHSHQVDDGVIEKLVPQLHLPIFDLPKYLIHKNTEEALRVIQGVPNQDAMKIIYGIYSTLNMWIAVMECWSRGVREQTAVAAQAGIQNPKRLYFIEKELEGISMDWLKRVQSEVLATEQSIKTSSSVSALEEIVDLVLKLNLLLHSQ